MHLSTGLGSECDSGGMCHAGHIGTAPGYLQQGCKPLQSKMLLLGWGKTLLSSSELSLSTIFLSELIFLQKALTADFLRGVSMRFICFMEILTLYLEILHKINFSRWKLEYFYSGGLLQSWGEGWGEGQPCWLLFLPLWSQGSLGVPPSLAQHQSTGCPSRSFSVGDFYFLFLQSQTTFAIKQDSNAFTWNDCGFQPKKKTKKQNHKNSHQVKTLQKTLLYWHGCY